MRLLGDSDRHAAPNSASQLPVHQFLGPLHILDSDEAVIVTAITDALIHFAALPLGVFYPRPVMLSSDMQTAYQSILGRQLSKAETMSLLNRLSTKSELTVLYEVLGSAEFTRRCVENAIELHLLLIHAARIKLVASMLPAASRIVDLGGANGTLFDLGYPYPFEELVVVDLPPSARCDMYRNLKLENRQTHNGPISVLYTNVTDLSGIPDASTSMVWMGQTIEHISEEDSFLVYDEVKRILRPGGHFCLDTPNRNLTEIHTAGWIHPEHQIEYRPEHLRRNLLSAGFRIELELGLCEMVRTWRTKSFDYTDFFLGGGISFNLPACYIQYYHCRV